MKMWFLLIEIFPCRMSIACCRKLKRMWMNLKKLAGFPPLTTELLKFKVSKHTPFILFISCSCRHLLIIGLYLFVYTIHICNLNQNFYINIIRYKYGNSLEINVYRLFLSKKTLNLNSETCTK